jgi:ribose 5-phosphate isomerase A
VVRGVALSPGARTPAPEVAAARDRVADAALALVEPGMLVGLGTGDTARRFVERLGARAMEERLDLVCVATSAQTEAVAKAAGLTIRSLLEAPRLDLAVDGADEVAPNLDLIKGGGGAQTREKLVALSAARFVVTVDAGKLVQALGDTFAVPIEVLAEAIPLVTRALEALGAAPRERQAPEGGAWRTDLGNRIVDANFGRIADPRALAEELDALPGVIEHGLFIGLTSLVLVGDLDTETIRRLVPRAPEQRTGAA